MDLAAVDKLTDFEVLNFYGVFVSSFVGIICSLGYMPSLWLTVNSNLF